MEYFTISEWLLFKDSDDWEQNDIGKFIYQEVKNRHEIYKL
jgi:hypothetical protein